MSWSSYDPNEPNYEEENGGAHIILQDMRWNLEIQNLTNEHFGDFKLGPMKIKRKKKMSPGWIFLLFIVTKQSNECRIDRNRYFYLPFLQNNLGEDTKLVNFGCLFLFQTFVKLRNILSFSWNFFPDDRKYPKVKVYEIRYGRTYLPFRDIRMKL